jgi:hypothetical protein
VSENSGLVNEMSQSFNEGVVAFIDALGTKGISARTDPEQYVVSWETTLREWEQYKNQALDTSGSSNVNYDIRAFSDTIIITVKLSKKDENTPVIESDRLLLHCARLISPMIINGIFKGVYLRGAMSIGKFYQTQNSIIGRAVDEAAEGYTNMEWIGVSTAPSAHFTIEKLVEVKVNVSNWFIKYRIPIKVGSQEESWAVNWPRLSPNEVVGGGMSVRALLFNAFARQPIPISAITKFDNTMKFFDFAKTRKE